MFYINDKFNNAINLELIFVANVPKNLMKTNYITEINNYPQTLLMDNPLNDFYLNSRTIYAKIVDKFGSPNNFDVYIYVDESKLKSDVHNYVSIKLFVDSLPVLNVDEQEKIKMFNYKNLYMLNIPEIYASIEMQQIFEQTAKNIMQTTENPITSPFPTTTSTSTSPAPTMPPPYTSPSP